MGKNLSSCIKEDDVKGFIASIEDGAQVTVNNFIAAAWFGRAQILNYITTNYTAKDKKVELLSAVFSQIGNKNIPEVALIEELLLFISDIYYGQARKFVLRKFEYMGFIWFLQLENPNRDATLSSINQMFLTTQKRVAEAKGQFDDYKEYLKSYDFFLDKKSVTSESHVIQKKTAGEILEAVTEETSNSAMSMRDLSMHMYNIELYRGSAMFNIVLGEWLKYLKRTVLSHDMKKYYTFIQNNSWNVEFYKRLTNSTTVDESELLIGWYHLLAKYSKENR
jgi:hypothetical protein